jgi:hypothetical protein
MSAREPDGPQGKVQIDHATNIPTQVPRDASTMSRTIRAARFQPARSALGSIPQSVSHTPTSREPWFWLSSRSSPSRAGGESLSCGSRLRLTRPARPTQAPYAASITSRTMRALLPPLASSRRRRSRRCRPCARRRQRSAPTNLPLACDPRWGLVISLGSRMKSTLFY